MTSHHRAKRPTPRLGMSTAQAVMIGSVLMLLVWPTLRTVGGF